MTKQETQAWDAIWDAIGKALGGIDDATKTHPDIYHAILDWGAFVAETAVKDFKQQIAELDWRR